ncbi:hypothetical protein, variant 3 [Aphanomyces astaci]|uniref:Amino acid permease/ SLC12A domain-containing protein n=1 Tax=Aphanomyces astaci TaxID=112090 RepID=W4GRB1_APHAT|nr:hypothetical protein H257_05430 [Aphanomyces astaci]XP_009828611.1 hypothetical protein, variant 1 [Aphanomyces astaci]XP_009828612.1 hypothetical protein, variant 2 [Aphanomyces astaci]XP_009828613.1 hypothetical protein, variant 3 [Aphanomyces astaci]ETV81873.1 hypothetical protein H257_05430 [Aphanomyces astaci]ETV81874.1 hypothetical protein, variant 1 [Aphanomyces astaci]ETV81875.1 hypothetical protein, variant 2 [Aphanomyces astaci]ETV81876.1 hypothetical protein, variant 3 [Aphanom|eukprot:XP_009828610.1 hypothetical protein H257_05430 [Aphanomyces astaci]
MQVAPSKTLTKPAGKDRGRLAASSVDLWAIGITIVIGGQFFSWNAGLVVGTVGFGLAVGVVGVAYLCLACSMAEMSSMLPFAGGVYGLSRCTLGFYAGFILGCCEILEYVLYVASVNVMLGKTVVGQWSELEPFQPIVWMISHALAIAMLIVGGQVFWRANLVLALILVVQVVVFIGGSAPSVNFSAYAGGPEHYFQGSASDWVATLPTAMWLYAGIESINTLSNDVDNPRGAIPKGQMSAMTTVFLSSVGIYIIAIGLPPGIDALPSTRAIFNGGYHTLFNLSDTHTTLLSIPACFSSTPGFLFASGNILSAMAESKLFPRALCRRHVTYGTPIYALLVTSAMSFGLCFGEMYALDAARVFYHSSMFFGTAAYTAQCVGYVFLKKRYKNIPRTFRSPLGVAGAGVAICVFTLCALSILMFQDTQTGTSKAAMVVVLAVLSMYYHLFAKSRQTISDDEQKLLFFAHVAKHNNSKKRNRMTPRKRLLQTAVKVLMLGGRSPPTAAATSATTTTRRASIATAVTAFRNLPNRPAIPDAPPGTKPPPTGSNANPTLRC